VKYELNGIENIPCFNRFTDTYNTACKDYWGSNSLEYDIVGMGKYIYNTRNTFHLFMVKRY